MVLRLGDYLHVDLIVFEIGRNRPAPACVPYLQGAASAHITMISRLLSS